VSKSLLKSLLLVVCAFALTRAWPLAMAEPWSSWEVFEARKLNEYGWFERRGALLNVHYLTGLVSHPQLHNYPNHPAPIHWVNMIVQRGLGDWGVIILGLLVGLAACMITLFVLRRVYNPPVALVGALLFTVAPSSIIYDVNTNQGAMGAALWPVAALALAPSLPAQPRAWLLGVACLLAGQASWMVWIVFGALFIGVLGISWQGRLRTAPNRPLVVALFVGGGLTVLLFALQVLLYTPDWQDLGRYLQKQSAGHQSYLSWLVRMISRSAMSLGPALALGALAGVIVLLAKKSAQPLELVALVFLPVFGLASFVLRGFFQTENWPYEYLVFPASILCCAFLAAVPAGKLRQAITSGLLALAVTGLLYVFLRFSNPSLSKETRFIADLIADEATPREVVATNLIDQMPPLQSWNAGGLYLARQKADRLLRWNISSVAQLHRLLDQFHVDSLGVVYLRTPEQHLDPDLRRILEQAPSRRFALPPHDGTLPFSLRLRNHYWRLAGRLQVPENGMTAAASSSIEVSRLQLARTADGSVKLGVRSFRDKTSSTKD
jgi:hypothetical protein